MKDCIFCKIVAGELPSTKVYENNDFLAFMDIQPINKGHVLVIPKTHSKLVSEMDEETTGKLMSIGKQISVAIRKSKIACEAITFLTADGEAAGQEVFHVHLHIIPRFKGDGFGFVFPKNYGKKPERKELEDIGAQIRNSF